MLKNNTKENITILAQDLILSRGYNAFSYQDIADALEIRKASVHHHFPSKEDLGAEVIDQATQRFVQWSQSISADTPPLRKLDLYMDRLQYFVKKPQNICISGICGAEWNTLPDRMKESVTAFEQVRRNWLIAVLNSGQKQGVIRATATAEQQADLILSVARGATQMGRSQPFASNAFDILKLARQALEL